MIVGRQGIALMMIQAIAIRRHARHEDIAMQASVDGARGGLHLRGGGAALPVVDIVVDNLEAAARQRFFQRLGIVAVGDNVADLATQLVLGLPMQDRYFMSRLEQFRDKMPSDKKRTANYQDSHALPAASRRR